MDPNAPSSSKQKTSQNTRSNFKIPPELVGQLPALQNFGELQRILLPMTKPTHKKQFVPNLNVSRPVPEKEVTPPAPVNEESHPVSVTAEPKILSGKAGKASSKKMKREKTSIQSEGVFSSGVGSKSHTPNVASRNERIKNIIEKLEQRKEKQENDKLGKVFEDDQKIPIDDIPITLPRDKEKVKSEQKDDADEMSEFFKCLMNDSSERSKMFLLKMPKFVPAKDENGNGMTLSDLPEGEIGKIQIFNTGKIQMVLGECKLILHEGVKVNFTEEVAVVTTEDGKGEIVNLGEIEGRIVATPANIVEVLEKDRANW